MRFAAASTECHCHLFAADGKLAKTRGAHTEDEVARLVWREESGPLHAEGFFAGDLRRQFCRSRLTLTPCAGDRRQKNLRRAMVRILTPNESGDFILGMRAAGFARLSVGGKQVAMAFGGGGGEISSSVGRVNLEKGRKVELEIAYGSRDGKAHAELIWTKSSSGPSPEAIAAAKMRMP